ncbi:MAG TPA: TetR/AcrR family transcriptional regulator C-terminal domain-containing protein, partial [Allosphingosinicella sp.]
LSDIVGRSGGSLATLYELFESKPGLLRAMVHGQCDRVGNGMERAFCSVQPVEKTLREIAENLFDEILRPRAVALFRVVVAQCGRQPELGKLLYDSGPAVGKARVADYLREQSEAGRISVRDPEAAAKMFFQMVIGHHHHLLLMCAIDPPGEEARAAHLDFAIESFLKVVAAPPGAGGAAGRPVATVQSR